MEISATGYGMGASWNPARSTGRATSPSMPQNVAAVDVLSSSEKNFFDKTLHTELKMSGASTEMFSNQGISAMNTQEMGYWSSQLKGYGSSAQQPRQQGLNLTI